MRYGPYLITRSGVEFYPFDPRVEDVRLEDIAHSLANICRFGGHTRRFYSVGTHSIRVSRQVKLAHAREALLHDAAEAYLGDVILPLKNFATFGVHGTYREVEAKVERVIFERFGIVSTEESRRDVKHWDDVLLRAEMGELFEGHPGVRRSDWWTPFVYRLGAFAQVGPEATAREFIHVFNSLTEA